MEEKMEEKMFTKKFEIAMGIIFLFFLMILISSEFKQKDGGLYFTGQEFSIKGGESYIFVDNNDCLLILSNPKTGLSQLYLSQVLNGEYGIRVRVKEEKINGKIITSKKGCYVFSLGNEEAISFKPNLSFQNILIKVIYIFLCELQAILVTFLFLKIIKVI